jgi:hypothetical protein
LVELQVLVKRGNFSHTLDLQAFGEPISHIITSYAKLNDLCGKDSHYT